jgi:hypothetical protein
MFITESEKREYALKPMNCPGHILIYKQGIKSYRDLPLRFGEFGACHRNEPSGGLHGIMRVRGFTQDDGHIFCTEDMIQAEVTAFTDGASKDRSIATVDIDSDGLTDLLATDSAGNTVVLYKQSRGVGLTTGTPFSAFKKPKSLAVGQWDGSAGPEVFVLSEEEKTVGISTYDPASGRLGFPVAVSLKSTGAFAPVAASARPFRLNAVVTATTDGSISFQFSSVTVSQTSTVLAGTRMTARKLTDA